MKKLWKLYNQLLKSNYFETLNINFLLYRYFTQSLTDTRNKKNRQQVGFFVCIDKGAGSPYVREKELNLAKPLEIKGFCLYNKVYGTRRRKDLSLRRRYGGYGDILGEI